MSRAIVHEGCYFDVADLAIRLRPIDRLECRATMNVKPATALRHGMTHSSRWWCVTVDDRVECAFGVCPIPQVSGWAAPWLLSTPALFKGKFLRQFITEYPKYLRQMCYGYTRLFNYVSAHNKKSISFLKHAGFTMGDTHHFKQYPFLEFFLCVDPQPSL